MLPYLSLAIWVPIVSGLLVLAVHRDRDVAAARWLAPDEKRWLAERLQGEDAARCERERHSIGQALKDRRVLAFGISAALNAPIPETAFGVFRM